MERTLAGPKKTRSVLHVQENQAVTLESIDVSLRLRIQDMQMWFV